MSDGSRYVETSRAREATIRSTLLAIASRFERLELPVRRPLRVHRERTAVGEEQAVLHDLAVHAEVGDEHPGRELREVLAEDVLSGAALRRAARQDGREAADHAPRLVLLLPPLPLPGRELVERAARGGELRAELLRGAVARAGGVGEPAELGRLHLQAALDAEGRAILGDARRAPKSERHCDADHDADAQGSDRQGRHLQLLSGSTEGA